MEFNHQEAQAINEMVEFIKKSKFWKMEGNDALHLFPLCQQLLRLKLKIEEHIKLQSVPAKMMDVPPLAQQSNPIKPMESKKPK